jgi:hypothetical protein
MRHVRKTVVALAAAAAIVACSDSNGPGGGGLSGNYTLDTLKLDTNPALFPPLATGSLNFSAPANFVVGLSLHPPAVPSDSTIALAGTYTLKATDSIYLVVGGGFLTIPGTHAEAGNNLVLNLLIPGSLLGSTGSAAVHLVWHK